MKTLLLCLAVIAALTSCTETPEDLLVDESKFVTTIDGKQSALITLKNRNGMYVQITNYGARIVSIIVKDREGNPTDVVWGHESIADYLNANDIYSGPIVGRFGNRIGKGTFSIDGKTYSLPLNDGKNQLHGGPKGFGFQMWDHTKSLTPAGEECVTLSYYSPDGDQGYPGNLTLTVTYTLKDDNSLQLDYTATTDAKTVINPTSHVYFNLHGNNEESTNTHLMKIYAGRYTPTDDGLIPTGEIRTLDGSPLDFRKATPIGERIGNDNIDLQYGHGYDHNFVLDKPAGTFGLAAEVYEPSNGILMTISTDQPAFQFYSGNFMKGLDTGKRGNKNHYRTGIALEAQNFPDAPNHDNFPSALLEPGQTYTQHTNYKWSIK